MPKKNGPKDQRVKANASVPIENEMKELEQEEKSVEAPESSESSEVNTEEVQSSDEETERREMVTEPPPPPPEEPSERQILEFLVQRLNAQEQQIATQDKTIEGLVAQIQQATSNVQGLAGIIAESMGVQLPSGDGNAPEGGGIDKGALASQNLPSISTQPRASTPRAGIFEKMSDKKPLDALMELLPLFNKPAPAVQPEGIGGASGQALMKNMMEMLSLFTNMQTTIMGNGLDGYVRMFKQVKGLTEQIAPELNRATPISTQPSPVPSPSSTIPKEGA